MQVNGISGYQQVMANEPKSMKTTILAGAGCGMIASGIVGGFWAAGFVNVSNLSSNTCDLVPDYYFCQQGQNIYDYGPLMQGNTNWSDPEQAASY